MKEKPYRVNSIPDLEIPRLKPVGYWMPCSIPQDQPSCSPVWNPFREDGTVSVSTTNDSMKSLATQPNCGTFDEPPNVPVPLYCSSQIRV